MVRGFTLVELSIVLVVIGLIVGGVVGGQTLVEQSRIMKSANELQAIKSAVMNFQIQYDWLPGDVPDASAYWPALADGNGNGVIDSAHEAFGRAWRQLGENGSGLYHGTYGYIDGNTNAIGNTCPESVYKTAGYQLHTGNIHQKYGDGVNRKVGTFVRFGKLDSSDAWLSGSIFTPAEAKSLDTKMDDGNALKGDVKGLTGSDAGANFCESGTSYDFDETEKTCYIVYFLGV